MMSELKLSFKTSDKNYVYTYFICAIIAILLMMRDVFDININKYIFLFIIGFGILLFDIGKNVVLLCFIIPLYVGLPGNYITIILVVKFLYLWYTNNKIISVRPDHLIVTLLIMTFISIQNLLMNYTTVYHMICIAEIFFLLIFFSLEIQLDVKEMIFAYILGVSMVGVIMLMTALKTYELSDLMNSSLRLGATNTTISTITSMKVSIDPNYYGYYLIAAISSGWILLREKSFTKIKKINASIAMITSLVICLIGLSRTFIILLMGWIFLTLIVQKKIRNFFVLIIILIIAVIVINSFLPDVTNAIIQRFNDDSMDTGNGRLDLIKEWLEEWSGKASTIFFGIGLFKCNVHCMQLQYLYGTGIVGAILMMCFSLMSIKNVKRKNKVNHLELYLPMVITSIAAGTVPVASSMPVMFPCIIVIFVLNLRNKEKIY